jgi:hypothetical protein
MTEIFSSLSEAKIHIISGEKQWQNVSYFAAMYTPQDEKRLYEQAKHLLKQRRIDTVQKTRSPNCAK